MNDIKTLTIILFLIYFTLLFWAVLKNNKNQNSEDYFLAGRKLPFWLLAITFIASWWGGGSAVDLVDHAFKHGISSYWIYGMPVLFSTLLMFLFAAKIRKIATITQPQLIQLRYNKIVAIALAILILIFMTLTAATQVVVIGRLLQSMFEISYYQAAIVGTAIVMAYSVFGGFKGVVITDLIQFVFLLIAALVLFFTCYHHSGGFNTIINISKQQNLDGFFSFSKNLYSNMAYIITFGSAWMIQANIWQRISATRSPRDAKKMMLVSLGAFFPLYLIVTLTGMLAIGLFPEIPEGGLVAAIITDYMPAGLGALIFVGISAAIMSTMDSLINTAALVLSVDLYQDCINPKVSPLKMVWIGKITTVLVSIVAVIIALALNSILKISWIAADFIACGAFIPIVLGFVWRRANSKAALASIVFGIIFPFYNLLVSLGFSLPTAWEIGSTKQAIIGMLGSAVIFCCVTLLTKPEFDKADAFILKSKAS